MTTETHCHPVPYFDINADAWVLTRYADVLAALRAPTLFLVGPRAKADDAPPDPATHDALRDETKAALAPTKLNAWRRHLGPLAHQLVSALPTGATVDILAAFAAPLCLAAASVVTEVDPAHAESLRARTQPISAAAAEPLDPALRAASKSAQASLAGCFHTRAELLRDSGFVALAHTMPALLGNLWLSLLQSPAQWSLLHTHPELTPSAIEELLRQAGLAPMVFRRASADTHINGRLIRQHERVVLRIFSANHDPARFPDPASLDLRRREAGHLSLGAGPHSCVGAPLIRMIAILATRSLAERFAAATLVVPVEWKGGSGFRSPTALAVQLTTAS